jgi:hypothetical protein
MKSYSRPIAGCLFLVVVFVVLGEWVAAGTMFAVAIALTYAEIKWNKTKLDHWEMVQEALEDPDN